MVHMRTTHMSIKSALRKPMQRSSFGELRVWAWHDLCIAESFFSTAFRDFIFIVLTHPFPFDLEGWRHQVWRVICRYILRENHVAENLLLRLCSDLVVVSDALAQMCRPLLA